MKSFCAFLGLLMIAAGLYTQPSLAAVDYQRAERFLDVRGTVDNRHIQPHWLEDSTGMWYTVVTDRRVEHLKEVEPL